MDAAKLPVSLFWYQDEIPAPVQGCLDSWCGDARLETRVYSARDAERFFEARGMGRELAAFRRCGPYAMASDFFRLHVLLERGGLYVDANWAQKQAFAPVLAGWMSGGYHGLIAEITDFYRDQPDPLARFLIARGGEMLLNGIVFVHRPGDPFLALSAEVCRRNIEAGACEQIAFAAGSGVMAALLLLREFETRAAYVETLEQMATRSFVGHDIGPSIASVIAATEGADHDALRRHFAGFRTVPGPSLQAYLSRDGLGQRHKDHWTLHKGSLYKPADGNAAP
ncbi:hypothetical protein Dshi_1061 [Dinoroseobacter shibae DFL 12 = DSM 16493]|jgi:hypothetical protein|uniref:Uncharacterized protein n=1 Tax=Dinoroseobacter shibae (strain DSM 16493 / NCIMB 14021 / DFL 12) TaxID=398580 RepID=A8LSI9_DINSH|nr:hypothetical protein [Dinoroseobacter shibae]ABV92803.1 hypothetical protein Dshi_1061 [Dinoroseobacter shibae DFL 12 = DSM 16493]URF47745.1 hypothetical protein M8008_05515 [Dinoroseobacter shibae]URF52055.1 hypothetical protein M8007_05515 [Dinoroseobacter shibae]